MPPSELQRPRPRDGESDVRINAERFLVYHLDINSNFPSPEVPFSQCYSKPTSQASVKFFLFMYQLAQEQGIDVYIETLSNKVYPVMFRMWIPIDSINRGGINGRMHAYLVEASEQEDEEGGARKRVKTSTAGARTNVHPLSWRNINTARKWIDTYGMTTMGLCMGPTKNRLILFEQVTSASGGDDLVPADADDDDLLEPEADSDASTCTIYDFMNAQDVFKSAIIRSSLQSHGVRPELATYSYYFPDSSQTMLIRAGDLRRFRVWKPKFTAASGIFAGDADDLLQYALPSMEPTRRDLLSLLTIGFEAVGMGLPETIADRSRADIIKSLIAYHDGNCSPDDPIQFDPHESMRLDASASLPYALDESSSVIREIFPTLFYTAHTTRSAYERVIDMSEGSNDFSGIKLMNKCVLQRLSALTKGKIEGFPPVFYKLAAEIKSYNDQIDQGARRPIFRLVDDYYHMRTAQRTTPRGSRSKFVLGIQQIFELVSNQLNLNPDQTSLFTIGYFFGFKVCRVKYGDQTYIVVTGPSGAGKSKSFWELRGSIPVCMSYTTNGQSAKAWIFSEDNGIKLEDEKAFRHMKADDYSRMLCQLSNGYLDYERFCLGDRKLGIPDTVVKMKIDYRMIGLSCNNGEDLPEALQQRMTAINMSGEEDIIEETGEPKKTTNDRCINAVKPEKAATERMLKKFLGETAYWFWGFEALGAIQHIDQTLPEIFFKLVSKYLVPVGAQEVNARRRIQIVEYALSLMVANLGILYDRTYDQKRESERLYFYQNRAAVGMQHMLLAYFQMQRVTDKQVAEERVARACKSAIRVTDLSEQGLELVRHDKYYVTGLVATKAAKEIAISLSQYGPGIVADILKQMRSKRYKGRTILTTINTGDHKGFLGILVDYIHDNLIISEQEEPVVRFLRVMYQSSELENVSVQPDYIDEDYVHFSARIHNSIKEDYVRDPENDTPLEEEPIGMPRDFKRIARFFLNMQTVDGKPAVLVQPSDDTASDIHRHVALIRDVNLAGYSPCNPDGRYAGKFKQRFMSPGSLIVHRSLLESAMELSDMERAEQKLVSVCMAISGESPPGSLVCLGVNGSLSLKASITRTMVVEPFVGEVVIQNPRLQRVEEIANLDIESEAVGDDILPISETYITFTEKSDLYRRVLQHTARINTGHCLDPRFDPSVFDWH